MPYNGLTRGCGFRSAGGIYLVSKLAPDGVPIDQLVIDPPFEVDEKELDLAAQGVRVLPRPGKPEIYDVWDHVGSDYTFPSFYWEAKYFGSSRKISKSAPVSLLTPESWHIFVFPQGSVVDTMPLFDNRLWVKGCPKHEVHNEEPQFLYQMCTFLLFETEGECKKADEERLHTVEWPPKKVHKDREPMFTYRAGKLPYGYEPEWITAACLKVRLTGIEVINDPIGGIHQAALDFLKNSGTNLPYMLVEE